MSREKLIQHIYAGIVSAIPSIQNNKAAQIQSISDFLDAFLQMFPAHHSEISDKPEHDYDLKEIAIFTINTYVTFYEKNPELTLNDFKITQHISRFIFARLASLVGVRSTKMAQIDTQYPIHGLDTQDFTLNDHKALLQKLTIAPVTSLSLVLPKEPGKHILNSYVEVIHTTNGSQKLNPTLGKISFRGLTCDHNNIFLVDELLKNTERLPELQRTISLPDWDTLASSPHIALYHQLQNIIRDNQKTSAITRSKGARAPLLTLSEVLAITTHPRQAQDFVGDYRQFALMVPNDERTWPYFDYYLATRPHLTSETEVPEENNVIDFLDFLTLLKTWAIACGMEPDCAAALFANEQSFTQANAKSLGQLFNSMDSQQSGPVGTKRWIQTVNTVWQTFGEAHFFAWKACFLDPLPHWLDCVEANKKASFSLSTPTQVFQLSWLQLLRTYSDHPEMIETHPALSHFVQTMIAPELRNSLFGIDNTDLNDVFSLLRAAPARARSFFQHLPDAAACIPCAGWVSLLENETHHARILNNLPNFLTQFENITEHESWVFGIKIFLDAINERKTDTQINAEGLTAHKVAIAYQRFIQGRKRIIWQPILYLESPEWCAAYFEMLQDEQYEPIAECLLEATQRFSDFDEITWILDLGMVIARSAKADDVAFMKVIISVMHARDSDKKTLFMNTLFNNPSALGFHLDLPSLQHFWTLWSRNELKKIDDLSYLVKLTLDMQELKNQQEFQTYFKDPATRHRMLHALREGFLSLGEVVTQNCYQWFRGSMRYITQWVEWGNIALGQRAEIYHQAYQALASLIHELRIAQTNLVQPTNATTPLAMQQQYAERFSEQEKTYAGFFWSCNRSRISQAQTLFQKLKQVQTTHKQAYYEQLLQIILQQQIAIFTADQSYYFYAPNKKGHSRLHDICTELFLTICRDCLCDPDLSEQEKAFVQPLLQQQITQHVSLLAQQISKQPLGQTLQSWQKKNGSIQELSSLLSCTKDIPPSLQYLHRSLITMITLPEKQASYAQQFIMH